MTIIEDIAVVDALRIAAKTVNPDGTFIPGTLNDGSLWYDAPGDQIHLNYFGGSLDVEGAAIDTFDVQMLFCRQDRPDNTPVAEFDGGAIAQALDDRTALLSAMKTRIRNFLLLIRETKGLTVVAKSSRYTTAIASTSGTHSGYLLTFQLQTVNGYCNEPI